MEFRDLNNYVSAFNAGYSLSKLLPEDSRIKSAIERIVDKQEINNPGIRGLKDGYQEALIDKNKEIAHEREDELKNFQKKEIEKDFER